MAKRPAPPATRVELEETIAQIRAKKADGYLIDEYWTAEQAPQPKTRTLLWGILRVALGKDGSDLVRNGQRVVLKGSKAYIEEDEQFHINEATKKNRSILKRAIKIISVSPAQYVGEIRP